MSTFDNPFDPARRLRAGACSCGQHASQSEHEATLQLRCDIPETEDKRYEGVVASAVMRAVFPKEVARRAFLKSVGASSALAALSQFFPIKTATEVFAQGAGKLEKTDLKVGFIPITCATPIIMADPLGFYKKQGLNVDVVKTAGWAVVKSIGETPKNRNQATNFRVARIFVVAKNGPKCLRRLDIPTSAGLAHSLRK